MSTIKLDNYEYTDDSFSWSTGSDTIILDAGASPNYYVTDSTNIGTITLGNNIGSGTTMWTTTTTNTISPAPAPSFTFGNESSIQVGDDFAISAPADGPAVLRYKDQEMEVGQLFSMFNAFKSLLKSVADDKDFCERHPEIRDMAYGYLVEELKK